MDPKVAAALQDLLFGERRPRTRALMALSDRTPSQLEGFVAAWLEAPARRRRSVAAMLVDLADEHFELFFEEIYKRLLDDPDPEVRRAAVEGLWESDDVAVAERLMHLLSADADEAVRTQAASTLGHFAYLAEMEELAPADAERIRMSLLAAATAGDTPFEVRRRAVEAVCFFANDEEVHEVIAAAYRAPEVKMRASALFAMGRNCDPRWSPPVLEALEGREPELRFEAARAAGELEERRAVPKLVDLVADADAEVRLEAIAALGKIGSDRAKAALRRLLEHEDERIAEAAADALDEASFADDPLLP
ncbi:MAG: HEAT repeat domain-containing protein [Chloroflexi bacterium]|nr:HEAT repeat domain-containing protein [Chloroflexota bacterium]